MSMVLSLCFVANLIVDCVLQEVNSDKIVFMPLFAVLTTMIPLTFYPNGWGSWWRSFKPFNMGVFLVNNLTVTGAFIYSLISAPEQDYHFFKLVLSCCCLLVHIVSFFPIWYSQVQILHDKRNG